MTGMERSSAGLDDRRKRLLYRCWHRGTREMDLIIGRFADAHIAELSESEVDDLERLIEINDLDLYAAVTGKTPPPEGFEHGIFEKIKNFRVASGLSS